MLASLALRCLSLRLRDQSRLKLTNLRPNKEGPLRIKKGALLVQQLFAHHVNLTGARRVEWFEFQLDAVVFTEAFLDESGVDGADEG